MNDPDETVVFHRVIYQECSAGLLCGVFLFDSRITGIDPVPSLCTSRPFALALAQTGDFSRQCACVEGGRGRG